MATLFLLFLLLTTLYDPDMMIGAQGCSTTASVVAGVLPYGRRQAAFDVCEKKDTIQTKGEVTGSRRIDAQLSPQRGRFLWSAPDSPNENELTRNQLGFVEKGQETLYTSRPPLLSKLVS
ncbi:hypothetical protein B0F90DRAFT_1737657 [Multifurca ochricompacta]|uniref:Uncharacterized protein n=1 Tax=Multifurca ochricompacta TaxID=376703 RepID=A0AAD4M2C7_9AGAM|nr:hypothetical protein B0F90DRAFT_1737657 [Multifurca ochricompacta]